MLSLVPVQLVARPALHGGCWLLVGGTRSQGGTSAGLLLGWVKMQETLGLLPPSGG